MGKYYNLGHDILRLFDVLANFPLVYKLKRLNYLLKVVISNNSVCCFEHEEMKFSGGFDYSNN